MVEIGKVNSLKIVKLSDYGIFLDGEEMGEILLPNKETPETFIIGDFIDVFISHDSEDRLVATVTKPKAFRDDFVSLEVVSIDKNGAFLDWGMSKDLFVPFREQKTDLKVGCFYVFYIYLDEKSNRLVATRRLNKFFNEISDDYEVDQEVDILIYEETDMGYKAVIDNQFSGVIYKNEIFKKVYVGMSTKGYIKKIRDDKKVDLSLQPKNYMIIDNLSQDILDLLDSEGGFLNMNDKSSPELIYNRFGVSKKVFKNCLGNLYKKRLIEIKKDGIYKV
ncbi:MAG: GntR family transcriptional regulator [Candidatus Cloacimonadota bacterium]|nr:MAG: GntR family transcriptional regulator [Candidatus Cloacimonadota bacterium]PIE79358.1 MAG: GntR family transcriptional regulator [Candidatus Delongbacteria bacterium]